MPGHTAEDSVTANVDYSQLDRADSPLRIRLGSTCVVRAMSGIRRSAKEVEIVYGREKQLYSVRGKSGNPGLLEHDDPLHVSGASSQTE